MNKTINHYYVEISDGKGLISGNNRLDITELEIIGENERYMVVNDHRFTTIDKEAAKYGLGEPLERESISISANDSVWGNRVTYSLYTFSKKRAASIRKAIEKEIQKRFGFFIAGIDLSVIKDTTTSEVTA